MPLIFKSGFEAPVTIIERGSNYDKLGGGDVSGFDWSNFPHRLQYVRDNAVSDGYVETLLSNERAYSGQRSLFMAQKIIGEGAQNRLQFYHKDADFGSKLFISKRLYYGDIEAALPNEFDENDFVGSREFRDVSGEFSVLITAYRLGGKLVYTARGLDYTKGDRYSQWLQWMVKNETFPMPKNQWFKCDFYMERHPTNGIVKFWIDDNLVLDVSGRPTATAIGKTCFSKIADIDSTKPLSQFVDEVEVWNELPKLPEEKKAPNIIVPVILVLALLGLAYLSRRK